MHLLQFRGHACKRVLYESCMLYIYAMLACPRALLVPQLILSLAMLACNGTAV